MKQSAFIITFFILLVSIVLADTSEEHQDCPAPISVTSNHGHTSGEMMFSYRFMAMDMRGLQSGTDARETVDVLKEFMMVPTAMDMRMHMFGVSLAMQFITSQWKSLSENQAQNILCLVLIGLFCLLFFLMYPQQ